MFTKLHRYYKEGAGIVGVPEKNHTPERREKLKDYIYLGYIGDYELLGCRTAMTDTSVVALKRDHY
jgi:hypothetical protein